MSYGSTLYIFNFSEDGLQCQEIKWENFDKWISERTKGIRNDWLPKFVSDFPNERSKDNEYFIIKGTVVVPKPVTVVQSYEID